MMLCHFNDVAMDGLLTATFVSYLYIFNVFSIKNLVIHHSCFDLILTLDIFVIQFQFSVHNMNNLMKENTLKPT